MSKGELLDFLSGFEERLILDNFDCFLQNLEEFFQIIAVGKLIWKNLEKIDDILEVDNYIKLTLFKLPLKGYILS